MAFQQDVDHLAASVCQPLGGGSRLKYLIYTVSVGLVEWSVEWRAFNTFNEQGKKGAFGKRNNTVQYFGMQISFCKSLLLTQRLLF